jgi:hypothetical protein
MVQWHKAHSLPPRSWVCGHCETRVSNDLGYAYGNRAAAIYLCPGCGKPTYFEGDVQLPGVAFGSDVPHVPDGVGRLYAEARNCLKVNAPTASVLAYRKLLMNVAVQEGAKENQQFVEYVNYLDDNGFVVVKARGWVDHRLKGNDATHEIPEMSRPDAEELLTFAETLLRTIYDYPARQSVLTRAGQEQARKAARKKSP